MLKARRKTKYFVHVCTAVNCHADQNEHAHTASEYRVIGEQGYHSAFAAFIDLEGITYEGLQSGERVHVIHYDKIDEYRTLGQRFYWRKP